MPVEIRELVIRAVVNDPHQTQEHKPEQEPKDIAHTEAIVAECVRQVLKILKKSGER
jgi:hypothetical protein